MTNSLLEELSCSFQRINRLKPETKEVMLQANGSFQNYLNKALTEALNTKLMGVCAGLQDNGFTSTQAVEVIYAMDSHREPVGDEVERAVNKVYSTEVDSEITQSAFPQPKAREQHEVLSNIARLGITPLTEDELIKHLGESPEEADNVTDFLQHYFNGLGNPPVYIGTQKHGQIQHLSTWLADGEIIDALGYDQILANPMRRLLTEQERASIPSGGRRIEFASETLDVVTFESDILPDTLQFGVIAFLSDLLPLVSVVFSGNDSDHATLSLRGLDKDQVHEVRQTLVDLGADPAVLSPYQLVRLGGVNRSDKGNKLQRVIWIDPNARTEAVAVGKLNELLGNVPDVEEQEEDTTVPAVASLGELMVEHTSPPVPVIHGVLGIGDKMIVSAPSKAGKTWLMLGLAYAVENGSDWMGHKTEKSRVLFVNFELSPEWVTHRARLVYGKSEGDRHPDVLNLKNISMPWEALISHVKEHIKASGVTYGLIILDPIYKMLGDADENSNGEIADLLNSLGRMCIELGVGAVFSHHHSKGNKANVDAMDRMAGAGVWARDPDAIIDLVNHEKDNCYVVETIPRNYIRPPKLVVQSDFPVFHVLEDEDPNKVRKAGGSRKKLTEGDVTAICDGTPAGITKPALIKQTAKTHGVSEETARKMVKSLLDDGMIKLDGKLIKPLETTDECNLIPNSLSKGCNNELGINQ
jgi:hypothetical protein